MGSYALSQISFSRVSKNMLKLTFFYDIIENVPKFLSIDLHVLMEMWWEYNWLQGSLWNIILWIDMLKV